MSTATILSSESEKEGDFGSESSKNKSDTQIYSNNDKKFHVVQFFPVLKLLILFTLNVFAFLPSFLPYRVILLIIEIVVAIIVHVDFYRIKGFLKFLSVNFIGLYFIFYFIDFRWINALILFLDYALTMAILFLGAFIYVKSTSSRDLLMALIQLKIPKKFALALTVSVTFLPLLIEKMRLTIAYQESRGYKLKLTNLSPILIPSLMNVLDVSINLALSIESRGFET